MMMVNKTPLVQEGSRLGIGQEKAYNYCERPIANPMAGVFQNIDPHPPHRPASVYHPPLVRGEDTLARRRGGWGVNILEDVRHSSVLYVCKYFVGEVLPPFPVPTHVITFSTKS